MSVEEEKKSNFKKFFKIFQKKENKIDNVLNNYVIDNDKRVDDVIVPEPIGLPQAQTTIRKFWHSNRTEVSVGADRLIKEYFYGCLKNFDYPMRLKYCWDFSSKHESLFKRKYEKYLIARRAKKAKAESTKRKSSSTFSRSHSSFKASTV